MSEQKHTATPWPKPEHDNDTGPGDDGYWEFWSIPGIGEFYREADAERAVTAANAYDAHVTRIDALERENAELRAALEPFATAGRIIDGPFGPALFAEDDMAFQSGCAWSENGERRTITWGDFRRARASLRDAKERKE